MAVPNERPCMKGDKYQSKTLFRAIFDSRSLLVKSVFDCHLFSVLFIVCYCSHCVSGVMLGFVLMPSS